jgi:hypothetical protein
MTTETTTKTFWVTNEPIKYEIRHRDRSDMVNAGVHILRWTAEDECEQGVLEIVQDGDTLRLRQWDGDLDAAVRIAEDQKLLRNYPTRLNIWAEIWKVATA